MKQEQTDWKNFETLLRLMPDNGNLIWGLVIGLLNEREEEVKRELRGKIEKMRDIETNSETIDDILSLLAGKGESM